MGRQRSCTNLWRRYSPNSRRNGRGIWLYKRSFRHRILRFFLLQRRRLRLHWSGSLLAVNTPRSRTQRPRSARLIRLQRAPASQQFRSRSLPLSGDHVSLSKRANRRSNAAPLLRLVQGRPARRWRSQRVCFLPGESPCGCRARWFWLLSLREHQSRLSAHAHRFLFRERSRPSRPPVFFLSGTCEEKTAGQRFSAPGWKRAHAGSDPACLVFHHTESFLPSFLSNLTSIPLQAWAIWSRLGEVTMSWPMTACHW